MKDYLLTASNGLQLLSFPDFKPIVKLHRDPIDFTDHIELGACDNGVFLKSSDSRFKLIELVHSHSEKNTDTFRTLQEFDIANAVCCACPKNDVSHKMALGLTDGGLVLTHYESLQKTIVLKPSTDDDSLFNSSKYLDFSSDHSQLVSVVEGGSIELFDIHKNVLACEIKQFKKDVPTLAKFKPNGIAHLMCIGFTSGKLKLYDTLAQKIVYKSKDHFNLCKDLCFFNTEPTSIISVGFDSSVLIHDFRTGTSPSINFLTNQHLNSVTISADDNYYCIGDYKGNLYAYDKRKSNFTPLNKTKISDRIVKKMIFIQTSAGEFVDDTDAKIEPKAKMICKPEPTTDLLDSFFNFDITTSNDPSMALPVICKNSTTNPTKHQDLDELKCENTFIRNIKARSTGLYEQPPKINKLSRCSTLDEESINASNDQLVDVMSIIDSYEVQIQEMKTKIRGLMSTVAEMHKFIEGFPKFIEIEIQNMRRKTRESDMLVVEKLSRLCVSDPQIVELMNHLINKNLL